MKLLKWHARVKYDPILGTYGKCPGCKLPGYLIGLIWMSGILNLVPVEANRLYMVGKRVSPHGCSRSLTSCQVVLPMWSTSIKGYLKYLFVLVSKDNADKKTLKLRGWYINVKVNGAVNLLTN